MDYSTLSDGEINLAVAAIQFPQSERNTPYYHRPDTYIYHRNGTHEAKDYCNNPADAWPIILGHKISIINADDEWLCVQDGVAIDGVIGDSVSAIFSDGAAAHHNPLRAAMIVFLMMQDSE